MSVEKDFAADFDHQSQYFKENSDKITADLRQRCPVAHGNAHGGFSVFSRYDDVIQALHDDKTFASEQGTSIPHIDRQKMRAIPIESDAPEHAWFRSFLIPWLAVRKVNTHEPTIRKFVTELINGFIEKGTCDLVPSFAALLPIMVAPMSMGIDEREWPLYISNLKLIMETSETKNDEKDGKTRRSFMHHLLRETEKRRRRPRDDFFSALVAPRAGEKALSTEEIVGLILSMLTGGLETTITAIGNLLLSLCEYPDDRQRLIADPKLIPLFVEETLRRYAPLPYVCRNVTRDISVHGQGLGAGEKVLLLLGSANSDERIFPNADQFVLERQPNRHLAFGQGVHFCVGAQLARLQMRIVVEEVLRRMPDLQPCGRPQRSFFAVGHAYGVAALPVVFTPANIL